MTHAIIKPAGGFGYLVSDAMHPEKGATSLDTIEQAIAHATERGYRTFTFSDEAAKRVQADDEATRDPDAADRALVMSFMHHSGAHADKLSETQWRGLYLHCDGFGLISRAMAEEQCWDWSHVRDSSVDGIRAVAGRLRKLFPAVRYPA